MAVRYTQSFKRLRTNLNRGRTLLDRFFDNPAGRPRRQGQPSAPEQELLRSVLVLAVSSLDAFLSDLTIELLPQLAREDAAARVFDRLAKDQPGILLRAFFLAGGTKTLSEALCEAIETQFQGLSMHGSRAVLQVSEWCALGLGHKDFDDQTTRGRLDALDEWTKKRHQIVHRGAMVKMKREDATRVVNLVETIGRRLNDKAIEAYLRA